MLLQVQQLVKSFGGRRVVDQVSYEVDDREIVGLLGANGAGKTTSFRMTVGILTPDGGRVLFQDREVTRLPMYKRARWGMGYLSQETSVFQRLTVEQNLLAIAETMRFSRRERKQKVEELLEQFGLHVIRTSPARVISGGEKRRLEIARALITNPKLILLDEPFSGVDPIQVEGIRTEIKRLRDRGIAVLLTDHNVRATLETTDRSYVIHNGRVICSGTPHTLINDPMVREKYLGGMFRGDEFSAAEPPVVSDPPEPVDSR